MLLGRASVEPERDEGKKDVGHPNRETGRPTGVGGERSGHGLQHDVGKGERQTDADARTHAAFALFARDGNTDERKNERGEGRCEAFMVFYFESADAGCAAQALSVDEGTEFRHPHGFLHAFDVEKILRLHDNCRIELLSALDLLARAAKGALHVAVERP